MDIAIQQDLDTVAYGYRDKIGNIHRVYGYRDTIGHRYSGVQIQEYNSIQLQWCMDTEIQQQIDTVVYGYVQRYNSKQIQGCMDKGKRRIYSVIWIQRYNRTQIKLCMDTGIQQDIYAVVYGYRDKIGLRYSCVWIKGYNREQMQWCIETGIQQDIYTVLYGYRDTIGHVYNMHGYRDKIGLRYSCVWIKVYRCRDTIIGHRYRDSWIHKFIGTWIHYLKSIENNGVVLLLPEIQDGLVFTLQVLHKVVCTRFLIC